MNDNNATMVPGEAHTGPVKNPKQVLLLALFAFVVPIFVIIGLVSYVNSGNKPAAGAVDLEKATLERIQKVGSVEVRDANREMRTGLQVFTIRCSACHATGAAGSPKFGDAAAWGPRIKTGFNALLNSALKGKGVMPAQGGGDLDNFEIARAVVYMANAGGAKFDEPQRPATATPSAK